MRSSSSSERRAPALNRPLLAPSPHQVPRLRMPVGHVHQSPLSGPLLRVPDRTLKKCLTGAFHVIRKPISAAISQVNLIFFLFFKLKYS